MQTLTQIQANRLKEVLEYAKAVIQHPEAQPIQLIGTYAPIGYRSPSQVREEAERRAQRIERYESIVKDLDEFIMLIKTFDYDTALDSATVENVSKQRAATLGEILDKPEAFDHLGKRGEAEPILTSDYPNQSS